MKDKYPRKRNLCGIYYRVKRNNKSENVAITDMTKDEIDKLFSSIDGELEPELYYKNLSYALIDTIKNIGEQLDIESK